MNKSSRLIFMVLALILLCSLSSCNTRVSEPESKTLTLSEKYIFSKLDGDLIYLLGDDGFLTVCNANSLELIYTKQLEVSGYGLSE